MPSYYNFICGDNKFRELTEMEGFGQK